MSVCLDVGMHVLILNSVKLSVRLHVIAASALSIFVHALSVLVHALSVFVQVTFSSPLLSKVQWLSFDEMMNGETTTMVYNSMNSCTHLSMQLIC